MNKITGSGPDICGEDWFLTVVCMSNQSYCMYYISALVAVMGLMAISQIYITLIIYWDFQRINLAVLININVLSHTGRAGNDSTWKRQWHAWALFMEGQVFQWTVIFNSTEIPGLAPYLLGGAIGHVQVVLIAVALHRLLYLTMPEGTTVVLHSNLKHMLFSRKR